MKNVNMVFAAMLTSVSLATLANGPFINVNFRPDPRDMYSVHVGQYDDYYHRYYRNMRWQTVWDGMLPPRAFQAGSEPERPLFLCRAFFRTGVHPGKVVDGRCNIAYGPNEVSLNQYQVLVNMRGYHWENASSRYIPEEAFVGGSEYHQPLYVCRAFIQGGWHPGKVSGNQCNMGYGGQAVITSRFQVLMPN